MTASLNNLRSFYPAFSTYYLSATESTPNTSEDEPIELTQVLCPIIDFLAAVIRGGKAREWVADENILAIVTSVFAFVQMTDEDVAFYFFSKEARPILTSKFRSRLGRTMQTILLHKKKMKPRHTVLELLDLIFLL